MGYVPLWSVSLSWVEVRQLRFVLFRYVKLRYVMFRQFMAGKLGRVDAGFVVLRYV